MQMLGYKTGAIYRKYAIVNDENLRAAAVKLAAAEITAASPARTRAH